MFAIATRIPLLKTVLTKPLFCSKSFGTTKCDPGKVIFAEPINSGKQIRVQFGDESCYFLHSSWLKDSTPNIVGIDEYRTSTNDVFDLNNFIINNIEIQNDGNDVHVEFKHINNINIKLNETYPSKWLYSFAPFVGQNNDNTDNNIVISNGTGSLLDDIYYNRKGWTKKTLTIPTFKVSDLISCNKNIISFCELMVDPGVCMIEDYKGSGGMDFENIIDSIIGKTNQHPRRNTNHWMMEVNDNAYESRKLVSADYNQRDDPNDLAMHNDHSFLEGTPGYLQIIYQFKGNVIGKICDGLAAAEYMKEKSPEKFKLLTDINITHGFRNKLYRKNGELADLNDLGTDSNIYPFDNIHTHPIIQLDENNNNVIEKIAHSESKRAICSIPYTIYDEYMNAYKEWCNLIENDKFVVEFNLNENSIVVFNNWRIMHGRSSPVNPDIKERKMFGAYINRGLFYNRYRYLKQNQNDNESQKWTTRVPNQVLSKILN